MSRHTSGPWTASQYLDDGRWGVLTRSDGIVVSVRSTSAAGSDGLTEADARLIAAAPDMFSMLKHASNLLAAASVDNRTVQIEGEFFDLITESERIDALIARMA